MKVISVINQKGGVAKTTTSQALASYLFRKGYKVLSIDLDIQRNLTYIYNVESYEYTIADVMLDEVDIHKAIVKTYIGDMLVGDERLGIIDSEYNSNLLKAALKDVSSEYDYCIIDNSPSLSRLTFNSLIASDYCLLLAQADYLSVKAIEQLNTTLREIKKENNKLKILGIAVARYTNRAVLHKEMIKILEDVARQMNTIVFNTKIRECISIKESQILKKDIYTYAPKSNGALDYEELCKEILERLK